MLKETRLQELQCWTLFHTSINATKTWWHIAAKGQRGLTDADGAHRG
jgi:hypothetical protein